MRSIFSGLQWPSWQKCDRHVNTSRAAMGLMILKYRFLLCIIVDDRLPIMMSVTRLKRGFSCPHNNLWILIVQQLIAMFLISMIMLSIVMTRTNGKWRMILVLSFEIVLNANRKANKLESSNIANIQTTVAVHKDPGGIFCQKCQSYGLVSQGNY